MMNNKQQPAAAAVSATTKTTAKKFNTECTFSHKIKDKIQMLKKTIIIKKPTH